MKAKTEKIPFFHPTQVCECGCGERVRIAQSTSRRDGQIKGQPLRFVKGHNPRKVKGPRYLVEDRGYHTPCWIWNGFCNDKGYGFAEKGLAHRIYYERHIGAIPEGLELDHLCRVRPCVNPEHLEPVTHQENCRRGREARAAA